MNGAKKYRKRRKSASCWSRTCRSSSLNRGLRAGEVSASAVPLICRASVASDRSIVPGRHHALLAERPLLD